MTDEQWLRLELRNEQVRRQTERATRFGRLLELLHHRRQRPSSSS